MDVETNFLLYIPAKQPIDFNFTDVIARDILFYDESVDLYIELDIKAARLRKHQLDNLSIHIGAKVKGSQKIINGNSSVTSDRESISSHSRKSHIRSLDVANLTINSKCLVFSDDKRAVWKTPLLLQHPRTRLTNPVIHITAAANLEQPSSVDEPGTGPARSIFLKNMEPIWGPNYFASLDKKYSYYEKDKNKRAAASEKHVADNSFSSHSKDTRGLENAHDNNFIGSLSTPIQPAMNLTIIPSTRKRMKNDDLVVLLELNVRDSSKHSTVIEHVSLTFLDGSASLIGCQQLPLTLMPGECVLLSYRLVLSDISGNSPKKRVVSITAKGRPVLDIAKPLVVANWDTTVDFNVGDNGRTTSMTSVTRTSTLSTTNELSRLNDTKRTLSKTPKIGSTPVLGISQNNFRGQGFSSGISVTFSGPTSVKVGEQFTWKAFAINRSNVLKNFSLVFQGSNMYRPSDIPEKTLSQLGGYPIDRAQSIFETPDMGLLSLVNDVRLPPLYPMGCGEVEIDLLAMCEGVHTIEGVMLVDLNTGDIVECENLLDVVVNY